MTVNLSEDRMYQWILSMFIIGLVNVENYVVTGCTSILSKKHITADMTKGITMDKVNDKPQYAELDKNRAFCAKIQPGFYIQVEFKTLKSISELKIQGFEVNGTKFEVETFLLEFSLDGNFWYQYTTDQSGIVPKYFMAISGKYSQTVVKLENPAIGKYVRLFPRSPQNPKEYEMCIRFQILGCDINVSPPNIYSTRKAETSIEEGQVNISCTATGKISMVVEWKNHSSTARNVTSLEKTLKTPLIWKVSYSDLSLYKCSNQMSYIKCSRNYTCQAYYAFDPDLKKESHSKVTVKILLPGRVTNFIIAHKNRSGVMISWKRPLLNDLTSDMVNYSLRCNISGAMKTRLLQTVAANSIFLPTSKVYHPYQCKLKVVRNDVSVFPFNFMQNYAVLNFRSLSSRPNVKLSINVRERPHGTVKITSTCNFTEKAFGRPVGFNVLATMFEYGNRQPVEDYIQNVNVTYPMKPSCANNGYVDCQIILSNKLKPWSKYRLKVAIFNDDMLLSNYSIREIKTKEGKPKWSPTLIAFSPTSNSVMLKIRLPTANDRFLQNGKLIKYMLQIKGDPKIRYQGQKEKSKNFFEVEGLKPSTTYSFRCKASTKAGYGNYGNEISITTKADLPSKPVEIQLHKHGKNQLFLGWKKPASAGIITKYEIDVMFNNSTRKSYYVEKPTPKDIRLHKVLPAHSVKQIKIRAYITAGAGKWSDPYTVSLRVDNPMKDQSTLIIGFSVAFALFAAFVVMCFIYFRRHYQSQPHHIKEDFQMDSMLNSRDRQPFEDDMESDMYIGSTPSLHSSDTTTCNLIGNTHDPIHVDEFAEYISSIKQDDYKVLLEDFKNQMPFGKCYSCDAAELPENSRKNRYINICAYDHSRIVLKSSRTTSDYINANSVYGYKRCEIGNYKYISTQGPLEETAADFWCMVWQEGSSIIVMLTNLKDNDKVKCAQYWPGESKLYVNIEVTLDKIDKTADYITRTFQLVDVETKEQRIVRQFHFVPWPDHGVPDYPTALLSLRRRVRHYYEDGKPMIIHCSAGVGRSGCFILIDAMLERIDDEKTVDIFNYLNYMRTRRIYMVQTLEQYIFAHTAILEYITFGNTETFVGELDKKFKELVRGNGMAEEFALLERNKVTDHYSDIVSTVLLREGMYVEAFPVDGFKQRDAFILTKAPTEENVINFWKMVLEKQCHTIVMLNKCQESYQEYFKYWPNVDGHHTYQDIAILLNNEVANGNIITRKIKVTTNKRRCEVNHFQFVDWPDTEVPDQRVYNNICTLMQAVEKSQHNLGNGPIIVHSGNDYGRSGTFIAIYNSTERLKVEQLIDVLQCVRAIRITQPLAVDNVSQYQFVYNMLRTYLQGFENYCNYKDYNVCRSPFGSSPRISTHLLS